ncbi:MAG: histidine phosphatase family protein [Hyphomicrobiales bacterium]|nr:histidine phosphatase family protein [Hyphomicrobiales bacterium]
MRRLLLLRHAKTEGHEPGRDDRARVLIERGRADAARIGAYTASHGLTPDRVIVSPAARCQETWTLMAAAMRPAPAVSTLEQIYDATPQDIAGAILDAPADAAALLIVGHNPGLHEAALLLIASGNIDAREALREQLPTSGLVVIDFAFDDWRDLHPQCGRLERFVTPKSLDAATR